jgi:hypothetical protein
MGACDAIPCCVGDMTDLVMMRSKRIAEALEGICSVSWIIADGNNYWREKNDDICRFEISYDRQPVERVMDKRDGLLRS